MICAKIQPQVSSVLEKKIFKGFYHIWAWWPSWSTDRGHFSNLSFRQPKEVPYDKIGSAASEEKLFENVNRQMDGWMEDR